MSLPSYLQSLEANITGNQGVSAPASPAPGHSIPQLPSFLTAPELSAGLTTSNGGSTAGKLKFLLVGTHCHQVTGYSKVTYGIVKVLSKMDSVAVTHFGFQRNPQTTPNSRPYPPNIRVLDAADMERRSFAQQQQPPQQQQGFGFNVLPDVIRHEKPDVVMIYNDMAVVARFLEEIRKSGIPRTFKIWLYVDQVYNTQHQMFLDIINRDADRVFAFTAYWKKCLKDQGITRPIDVLGHAFETEFFQPTNRNEIRTKLGLPLDAFIITSLNRNQPRKRYDILLMAFVELLAKFPNKPVFLMCFCDKGEKGGWWLFEVFQRELKLRGLPLERFGNRLMLSSTDMNFRDEDINMFYNLGDIGISTADGEGWGLCNFEQMGVGVPQVVPDIGGFKEFCTNENSVLVKPKYRFYQPTAHSVVGGEAEVCDPHDICVGIERYLLDSETLKRHGEAARKTVLGFTLDRVCESLVKRLKEAHSDKDD